MEYTKELIRQTVEALTPKQRLFCENYIVDFNASRAARTAGYSEKTAKSIGAENLTKPAIQAYLKYLTSDRARRLRVTADRVLQEIAKVAFNDLTDLVDYLGGDLSIRDLQTVEFPEVIKSIKLKEVVSKKGDKSATIVDIVLHDKMKALEMLGKYNALFTDNVNTTLTGDIPTGEKTTNNFYINYRKPGEPLADV